MNVKKTIIYLYAVPVEIIPETATTSPSSASIPMGLLPCVVTRNEPNVGGCLAELFAWFKDNLGMVDGYIPGSAALPALSLDETMWQEAIRLLREAISKYHKVQGPVFVHPGVGRSGRFQVADWYAQMLQGSTLSPIVTFSQAVSASRTSVPDPAKVIEHLAVETPGFSRGRKRPTPFHLT